MTEEIRLRMVRSRLTRRRERAGLSRTKPMNITTDHPRLSRAEATALLAEAQALSALAREIVARAGPAPTSGIDQSLPAGQLARALWQACGRRKCMWLRTKLCQLAEAEDGTRVRGRGRDRVTS
jgi:hypothetical protein